MQEHGFSKRTNALVATAAAVVSMVIPGFGSDMPVKSVTLYKHGIGYFQREAEIPAGEEVRLDFKIADMNDILKSLTVVDRAGSRISHIRYDSNETTDQRLKRYPFQIGDAELLSTFLDRLKGSRLTLKAGDQSLTGLIVSARGIQIGAENDKRLVREQLTLLLEDGSVTNVDLASASSLRLLDTKLQDDLRRYLQTMAQDKFRDTQSIYIDSSGSGRRDLRLSYIAPAAVWKSSYRLILNESGSALEGWAVVDNTTNEDWNNVKLTVVSGRPISFISLLDTPRYGRREVAELPEDRAAGPVVYGGSVDVSPAPPPAPGGVMGGVLGGAISGVPGSSSGAGGGSAGGSYRIEPKQFVANQLLQPKQEVLLEQSAQLQTSSVAGATGATLGELFEYKFDQPVTIKKSQSAMLPFLQDEVAARKLLIYMQSDGEHPVNAAEITNSTAKTLDGGPVTVYDGAAYAGEALVETLKAGDKRLIGYAVDYGTRITTAFNTGRKQVREIHARDGNLELHYGEHTTRTYTLRNVDSKPKSLIIQQEGTHDYSVVTPKPTERTATAYRFEVKLPANGGQTLRVEEERTYLNTTAIASSGQDFLFELIENKELSDAARQQLKQLAAVRGTLAQTEASLESAKARANDLTQDQNRLRADIDSLNRVKGQEDQVRKYSAQLAENELDLAKIRDSRRELDLRRAALDSQVRQATEALQF